MRVMSTSAPSSADPACPVAGGRRETMPMGRPVTGSMASTCDMACSCMRLRERRALDSLRLRILRPCSEILRDRAGLSVRPGKRLAVYTSAGVVCVCVCVWLSRCESGAG